MSEKQRTYFCIDMKTFYASVECAERGLNPFETNLVVADVTRGRNALCLAISPKMKAQGIKNRCRLSEIPANIRYDVAPPRMSKYIEYAADIYSLYLDYFSPQDIHVYSIDESFIDVTDYLGMYGKEPLELAKFLMNEIANRYHIPSTAGIGTNLYLAKIALDITAKHAKDHIGILNEQSYRETLWDHEPITDFWMIAEGTARRLNRYGVTTMRGMAHMPTDVLYKAFGVNAELLIDHAWGRESCRIEDIKNYRTQSKSVSFSQILPRDYNFDDARIVIEEMIVNGCRELVKRKVIAGNVWIGVGYSFGYAGSTHGSSKLLNATALPSRITPTALALFDSVAERNIPIRRLAIAFGAICDEGCEGYDLFTDWDAIERESSKEHAVLALSRRYGKNAVLTGISYTKPATQKERNEMIGGHRAGYDDSTATG